MSQRTMWIGKAVASNVRSFHSGREICIREGFIEIKHIFPKVRSSDKGGAHR
jgi:hypothetical protein